MFQADEKTRDYKGNFSDVLHSKIDFLREKQEIVSIIEHQMILKLKIHEIL